MSTSAPLPSFERAVFEGDPSPPDACAYCHRTLDGDYYRVNGNLACAPCATHAETLVPPDSHKAYSRALLFGIVAAVVGCAAYATFVIVTDIMLAWAAIGVGFLVGWAMKKGSRGLGGRRYQVTAALLTYAAVAVSFIPVYLHSDMQKKAAEKQAQTDTAASGKSSGTESAGNDAAGKAQEPQMNLFLALLTLVGLGLISPFLLLASSFGSGLLNLLIVFIGVRYAWKHMAQPQVEIDGPFPPPQTV